MESAADKPTLVRIKRKRHQEPVHFLWLEHSACKRRHLQNDIGALSLGDCPSSSSSGNDGRKLLFCRLHTVQAWQAQDASFSESLVSELTARSASVDRQGERRRDYKKIKPLPTSAREQHERNSRNARYTQVWRNRLGKEEDVMQQFFRLYDVFRTDNTEVAKRDRDDKELLAKYMPLLQEFCPEQFGDKAAPEEANANHSSDDFVYDVYAQQTDQVEMDSDEEDDLLTLQVSDTFDVKEPDSDYDSEDSNREDRPECDYPDEEEEEDSDAEEESSDGSSDEHVR